jgi:putative ABC transport system substrate-binding protein
MRRREFIAGVAGSAAWPLAVRAEQAMPVIGFLLPTSATAAETRVRAFRQGLREAGFAEGENVTIEYRWTENRADLLPLLATDLVRRQVAVIVTGGNGPLVVKAATTTIPVVFLVGDDPVRLGYVASLARPGGNLTGINFFNGELVAKRLELLRELVPAVVRVAVLVNPANVFMTETTLRDIEPAARTMGLQIQVVRASSSREISAAFAMIVRDRSDALFVSNDPFLTSRRVQFATLAARHAIPMSSGSREVVEVGGLMSYGSDIPDAYRQMAAHTALILKGAKPAEMPVVQANKFELVINAETARMLGITVPPSLLARADEVLE